MKKFLSILLCCTFALTISACGGSGNDTTEKKDEKVEEKQPTDLTGTWVSEASDGTYQEAVIKDGKIEINWVNDEEKTKSLYWIGSCDAPTSYVEEYSWTSKGDIEKMKSSLLASSDKTKDFKYSNDVLSYEASAFGTTKTVEMKRK